LDSTGCDRISIEKESKCTGQKDHEICKNITEIHQAFALWYSYQDEAFLAARPILNRDFGPIHNGRDPSEIVFLQREVLKALNSQIDADKPESKTILVRWLTCQAEAANSLAAVSGNNTQDEVGYDPVPLLDFQERTISMLKDELRRRGQTYWEK
jgi:hypothetical protein